MTDRREIFYTLVLYLNFVTLLWKKENIQSKCKKISLQNKKILEVLVSIVSFVL
jgi:DNA anti-recombination protein RmuC